MAPSRSFLAMSASPRARCTELVSAADGGDETAKRNAKENMPNFRKASMRGGISERMLPLYGELDEGQQFHRGWCAATDISRSCVPWEVRSWLCQPTRRFSLQDSSPTPGTRRFFLDTN